MSLDQIIGQALGPLGALVVVIVVLWRVSQVVAVLWAEHIRSDAEDRAERDAWKALALAAEKDVERLTASFEALVRR